MDAEVAAGLDRIAAGEADELRVSHLSDAVGSLSELIRLLDWLKRADADLVATDVGLDSRTAEGRRMVSLLREIDGWGRRRDRPRGPRGRPGLGAHSPELVARIAELRERGLTLRAIADELNADGVPTPRGGAAWRPSSVQAALGYRRPPPPIPGAPPPRPGKPRPPGKPTPPPPPHRKRP
jgi:Recombinase